MDHAAAYDRMLRYTQPNSEPTLTLDDLDALLADHAVAVDSDGLAPADDGWTPTYNVRGVWQAVAEAWTLKAGRAAGRFDFTTEGQQFRRSQIIDHCEAQAARYRRKANHSASVA